MSYAKQLETEHKGKFSYSSDARTERATLRGEQQGCSSNLSCPAGDPSCPAAALGLSAGSQLCPSAEGAPGEEEEQARLGRSSPGKEGGGQGWTEVTSGCSAAPGRELLTA